MLKKSKRLLLFLSFPAMMLSLHGQLVAMDSSAAIKQSADDEINKKFTADVEKFEHLAAEIANDTAMHNLLDKLEKEQNEPGAFQKFNEKVLYEGKLGTMNDIDIKLGVYVNDLLKLGLKGAELVVEIIFHKRITKRINQYYFNLLTKRSEEISSILNSPNSKDASMKLKSLHKMSLVDLAKSGIMFEVLLYLVIYKLLDQAHNLIQMQTKTPTFNKINKQLQKDLQNPPTPEELQRRKEQRKPIPVLALPIVSKLLDSKSESGSRTGFFCNIFGISYFGDSPYWIFARNWCSTNLFVWNQNNRIYAEEWAERLISNRKQITLLLRQYNQTQKDSISMFLNKPEIAKKEVTIAQKKINSILDQVHHTAIVDWIAEKWFFCFVSNKALDFISYLPVVYSVTKSGLKFYNDAKPKPITGATT